jgi:hypothetical protein
MVMAMGRPRGRRYFRVERADARTGYPVAVHWKNQLPWEQSSAGKVRVQRVCDRISQMIRRGRFPSLQAHCFINPVRPDDLRGRVKLNF